MISEAQDYRSFLKAALAERCRGGASRSIGAFARRLGIGRSFLSEVLAGKKNLSAAMAIQVATRLGLEADDSELFLLLVQLGTHDDVQVREDALMKLKKLRAGREVHDLSVDLFRAISDWYHFAILELTLVEGFELNARSAARKLGISVFEAETAMDRLVRLELLEREPKHGGRYRKLPKYVLVQTKAPAGAVARFHLQILEKARQAIESQARPERQGRTEIFPLDPELLPEAEAILDRAGGALVELANRSKKASRVYAASLHLFNLTPERKSL